MLELFTLGPEHYSEQDIKEAARAFTGWTFTGNRFQVNRRQHDDGVKTVLGRSGRFDGGNVLDILLEQDAAPRHLAAALLGWFVGPEIPDAMIDRCAGLIRKHEWELRPVLEALFNDPDFYRPEVVGSRILGPVELAIGISRRLGEAPPGGLLAKMASQLGQTLFEPPNVKGWEGGEAWITTSTFLARGNFAGYLVEGMTPERIRNDFKEEAATGAPMPARAGRVFRGLGAGDKWLPATKLRPMLEAAGATTPPAAVDWLCDRFLAVPVTDEARRSLVTFLTGASEATSALPSEYKLKKLLRLILSLPEAQIG